MTKPSPFSYVQHINSKQHYDFDLSAYSPFLVNRCFAMHMDTVMLAHEMDQAHRISPQLQYDFYYYAVRKGKRFGFPPKPDESEHLAVIQEHYGYSREKALQALLILTPQQIKSIVDRSYKGGIHK